MTVSLAFANVKQKSAWPTQKDEGGGSRRPLRSFACASASTHGARASRPCGTARSPRRSRRPRSAGVPFACSRTRRVTGEAGVGLVDRELRDLTRDRRDRLRRVRRPGGRPRDRPQLVHGLERTVERIAVVRAGTVRPRAGGGGDAERLDGLAERLVVLRVRERTARRPATPRSPEARPAGCGASALTGIVTSASPASLLARHSTPGRPMRATRCRRCRQGHRHVRGCRPARGPEPDAARPTPTAGRSASRSRETASVIVQFSGSFDLGRDVADHERLELRLPVEQRRRVASAAPP